MSGDEMLQEKFRELLAKLDEMQAEKARRDGKEPEAPPPGGAGEAEIAALEAKLKRPLPEQLRAFLSVRNGWPHFRYGLSILDLKSYSKAAQSRLYREATDYMDDEEEAERLKKMLIIGTSEDDASLLLLDGEEVVEHEHEELSRMSSLLEFFEEEIESYREQAEEWQKKRDIMARDRQPEYRAAQDAALAERLKARVADRKPGARVAPPDRGAKDKAAAAEALAIRSDDELQADVQLTLTLYLGFYPTAEEMVAAIETVERHFPHEHEAEAGSFAHGTVWQSFDDVLDAKTADWRALLGEPSADGHFGIKIGGKKDGESYRTLTVCGVPARYLDFDDDDQSEEERGAGPTPRASFLELLLPADSDPQVLYRLTQELLDLLPVRSGHCGYSLHVRKNRDDDVEAEVRRWTRRYFGLNIQELDGALPYMRESLRGANWLTILGKPFVAALSLPKFSEGITLEGRKYGLIIRAGEKPTLGDIEAGEFPELYAEVDSVIAPLRDARYHDERRMFGGRFVAITEEIGPLEGGETALWFNRFQRPDRWLAPSARELGAEIEAAVEAKDFKKAAAVLKEIRASGTHYQKMSHDLFKVAYALYEAEQYDLSYAVYESMTQLPDPPFQAFNNLAQVATKTGDREKMLKAAELALPYAPEDVLVWHNVASCFALVGDGERALDMTRKAKEHGYKLMANMHRDEDLKILWGTPEFEALFK